MLLVSIAFVPCARESRLPTEKETIELAGFTITLSAPRVDFPDSMEFKIEVESDAEITDITLQYRMDKLERTAGHQRGVSGVRCGEEDERGVEVGHDADRRPAAGRRSVILVVSRGCLRPRGGYPGQDVELR